MIAIYNLAQKAIEGADRKLSLTRFVERVLSRNDFPTSGKFGVGAFDVR